MKTNLRNLSAWFLLIWLISLCGALGQNILLNTIGGVLGYILFAICNQIRRKHRVRNRKKR